MSFTVQCKTLTIRFFFFIFLILLENLVFNYIGFFSKNIGIQYMVTYTFISLTYFLINKKDLLEKIKNLKKINLKDIKKSIILFLIFILCMYISNYILIYCLKDISTNETFMRELLTKYPITMSLSVIFFAPITEELLFRNIFFDKRINKLFSLIFAALLFSLFHVTNAKDIFGLLYMIPYFFMGIAFGISTFTTDNVFVSIIVHIFHNFFTVMLLFI